MHIDFHTITAPQRYALMAQTVVPRPIAWVLTQGPSDYNLAPYSFFNAIGSEPPLLMFSIGIKKGTDQQRKDTALNIVESPNQSRYLVHLPMVEHMQDIERTASPLPRDQSEIEHANLELVQEPGLSLPRLKNAQIAYECSYETHHELGNQWVIYSRIHCLWLSDEVVQTDAKGRWLLTPSRLKPLGRLGPKQYCDTAAHVLKA